MKAIAGGTMSKEDMTMLFQRVDMDGSKTIDSKEFLYLMYLWVGGKFFSGLPTDDANTLKKGFKLLEQVFQLADADKSAAIDLDELKVRICVKFWTVIWLSYTRTCSCSWLH